MSDRVKRKQPLEVVDLETVRNERRPDPVSRVMAHWDAVRGSKLVPERADISPAALDGVLDRVFILERIAKGQARFRVAGSLLSDLVGHDLRGMPLSSLIRASDRRLLSELVTSVFDEPARVTVHLSNGSSDSDHVEGSLCLLPLKSDLGDVSRILGAIRLHRVEPTRTKGFGIADCQHKSLIGFANPTPALPQQPSAPPQPQKRRRGHLVLVTNRDA